jgi:predicted nucleic acid-binding protein
VSGFLLDTNVVSELIKPRPEARVTSWIEATDERLFYLSVLTLGEIRKGIALVENRQRRAMLESWLGSDLVIRFSGRILLVDQEVADRWGIMAAHASTAKRLLPVIDGLLAATAVHNNLTLVTRNTRDVAETGVPVFNPWSD